MIWILPVNGSEKEESCYENTVSSKSAESDQAE